MSLLLLPPELKLNIIERLDPESSLQFALTNSHYAKLCQDVLREHTRRFAETPSIEATDGGKSLWTSLREILQDPRKAWYVTELNLTSQRQDDISELGSDENIALFKAAAKELLPLYPHDPTFFTTEHGGDTGSFGGNTGSLWDGFDDLIEAGVEEIAVILLIHYLPHLRKFRMTDDITYEGRLEIFMRRIAAGYQNPALASRMPLQHLKVAAIAHYDSEGSCHVEWAVYFLCVPSLRTFTSFSMGSEGVMECEGNDEAHLRTSAGIPVSNVEELEFSNCQFDPESLHTILPLIKNLKRFSYQAAGHTVALQDYEPRKVIDALAIHAGHSLEELELRECVVGFEEGEGDILFTSLRRFKALKALHCETRWLLPSKDTDLGDDEALSQGFHHVEDAEEPFADPRNNLPESLEELYLSGIYEDEEWEHLIKLFESPNASTPKLTYEKTCLMRDPGGWNRSGTQAKFGGADEPGDRFRNPRLTHIWDGHGYY